MYYRIVVMVGRKRFLMAMKNTIFRKYFDESSMSSLYRLLVVNMVCIIGN
jgi:hypothetical protein